MASSQQSPSSRPAADDDEREDPPPVPDEDGPHDVPDAAVIEKTLPSKPVGDRQAPGL
jgi:hypothetical protein